MEISKSNGLFCIFYPNLPKTSFAHKMSKNKEHTLNEYNQSFCNFTQIDQKQSSF